MRSAFSCFSHSLSLDGLLQLRNVCSQSVATGTLLLSDLLAQIAWLGAKSQCTEGCWRIQGESAKLPQMDEGRKRVLLIAASILAARKLAQFDGGKRVPATVSAIANAIDWAEEIMDEIDRRWTANR